MNSFRITDTKFRILKGGKIGLAASIALIGGMLTLGSMDANAVTLEAGGDSTPSVQNMGYTMLSSDGYIIQTSQIDALGITNSYYDIDPTNLPGLENNELFRTSVFGDTITLNAGKDITGRTIDGQLLAIYSLDSYITNQIDGNGGLDNTRTETDLSSGTLNIMGNNDIYGIVGANVNVGGIYAGADNLYLIDLKGTNVYFGNTVNANTVEINSGTNNTSTNDYTFNGTANVGDMNFKQAAASVLLNGGLTGNLNFNGYSSIVTIGSNQSIGGNVYTDGVNGTLIFQGSGNVNGQVVTTADSSIKEVRANGVGNVLFNSTTQAEVDHVNYQAAALIGFNGGLDVTVDESTDAVNQVTFNNHDGVLQINNGNLTGIEGEAVVTTTSNNKGTVTMVSGSQVITGNIGSSGHAIKTLNIGGFADGTALGAEDGTNYSVTTANGDIYAQNTYLNNNVTTNSSSLIMASGYNLNSTVTTNDANMGILTLAGGTQNVTGQVGTDTFRLAQVNSGAGALPGTPNANSTFESNVFAVTLNNTGTGTTNLNGNFTGTTLNFAQDGVVNLANNKTITASVTSAVDNTGTLTFVENGTMVGDIGTTHSLKLVNIGDATNTANASTVTTDSITATTTAINNNSTLVVRASEGITGNVTSETTGTGILNLTAGTNFVNGNIGTNSVALGTVTAGTTAPTTYLNSAANTTTTSAMSYIDTLQYTGNGIVVLNGTNSAKAIGGMKGTVDFGTNVTNTGTLQIGDTVNLTTGTTGIQFADANGATLTFNGSSTINGDMGSLSGTDTFEVINGGAAGEIVTFNNNVYFINSLNLSSTGTIEIADGKYAQRTTPGAIVTTSNNGQGVLDYLGGTTLYGDIGTTTDKLAAVNFNTEENGIVQEINYDVYATNTTVGHTSSINDSSINLTDVTGQYDYAGATTIKEFRGQTAANITDDITFGGNLIIADAKSAINFGTSHVTVSNNFTTTNGAMSFTVNTKTSGNQAASTSSGSGQVTTAALNMSGSEKVHINYVGSLANNGTYTLISDTGTTGTGTYSHVDGDGKVTDNSFAIDTKIDKTAVGSDLILRADRTAGGNYSADQLYVQKSDTNGHFSNNAAVALAGISANGSQTDDMIEVIQKLELDSFGYGNSKENLAVQVQKLAPIVNTSFAQTSISATKLVTDTVGSRLSDTRGLSSGDAIADKGVWAKVIGSTASQDKIGQFDGYSLSSAGIVFGIDKELQNNTIIGLAAGYTNTKTEQDDFRDGDSSTTDSYQLSLYASKTFDKAYIDGALSYTKHNTDGTRSSAIGREASYDVDANQLSAKINGGYNFLFENEVTLTPFASLEYSNIEQDSYKEQGAGAISLSVDDVTVNRGAAGLGLKVSKEIKTEDRVVYIPEFKLGANKYFGDDDVEVTAQFDQGNKFVTKGAEMSDMMYNAGLGLKTKFTEDTSISLSTDYERSNDGDFQGVNGQLTFRMQF